MLETARTPCAGRRPQASRPALEEADHGDETRGCPGKDRSNWTADDIFEVPCSKCGTSLEFFKDDARRYCPQCGTGGARNPSSLTIGCAAWCAAAEKCSVARAVARGRRGRRPAFGEPALTSRDEGPGRRSRAAPALLHAGVPRPARPSGVPAGRAQSCRYESA